MQCVTVSDIMKGMLLWINELKMDLGAAAAVLSTLGRKTKLFACIKVDAAS